MDKKLFLKIFAEIFKLDVVDRIEFIASMNNAIPTKAIPSTLANQIYSKGLSLNMNMVIRRAYISFRIVYRWKVYTSRIMKWIIPNILKSLTLILRIVFRTYLRVQPAKGAFLWFLMKSQSILVKGVILYLISSDLSSDLNELSDSSEVVESPKKKRRTSKTSIGAVRKHNQNERNGTTLPDVSCWYLTCCFCFRWKNLLKWTSR